jgi:hypothetical protein
MEGAEQPTKDVRFWDEGKKGRKNAGKIPESGSWAKPEQFRGSAYVLIYLNY